MRTHQVDAGGIIRFAIVSIFLCCQHGIALAQGDSPVTEVATGIYNIVPDLASTSPGKNWVLVERLNDSHYNVTCLAHNTWNSSTTDTCGFLQGVLASRRDYVEFTPEPLCYIRTYSEVAPLVAVAGVGSCSWASLGLVDPYSPFGGPAWNPVLVDPPSAERLCDFLQFAKEVWLLAAPAAPSQHNISDVIVVYMNHLDVGFNGIHPLTGYISNIFNVYWHQYFPRSISVSRTLRALGLEQRYPYVYTTHPFLLELFFRCDNYSANNLLPLATNLTCPGGELRESVLRALKDGDIVFQRGAFNVQVEAYSAAAYASTLDVAKFLAEEFDVPLPRTVSQRDVPGVTNGFIRAALNADVQALSIGVNLGSCCAWVPKVFLWQDLETNDELLTLVHPYGYGSIDRGLNRAQCKVIPGVTTALCTIVRGDNEGPPMDYAEVVIWTDTVASYFPGASIRSGSFDDFTIGVLGDPTVRAKLPVVKGEIGDVWIQGIASDPLKLAQYRAVSRVFDAAPAIYDDQMVRTLIAKPMEHTWGLPGIISPIIDTPWNTTEFRQALASGVELGVENVIAWNEQRAFTHSAVRRAFDIDTTVGRAAAAAMKDLENAGRLPDFTGWLHVSGNDMYEPQHFPAANVTLQFDVAGQIRSSTPRYFPRDAFRLRYRAYGNSPSASSSSSCGVVFGPKYSIMPEDGALEFPYLTQMFRNNDSAALQLRFLPFVSRDYGAPPIVWVIYSTTRGSQALNIRVLWEEKPPTLIAESLDLLIYGVESVHIHKTGQWIDAASVIGGGNSYNHGFHKGVRSTSGIPGHTVMVESLDAGVANIMWSGNSQSPTPYVNSTLAPGRVSGYSFNLFNNVWSVNYIFWYPFDGTSGRQGFRFVVHPPSPSSSSLLYDS